MENLWKIYKWLKIVKILANFVFFISLNGLFSQHLKKNKDVKSERLIGSLPVKNFILIFIYLHYLNSQEKTEK